MDAAMVVGADPVGPWAEIPADAPDFGGPPAQEMGFVKRYLARRKGRKTNAMKTWVV